MSKFLALNKKMEKQVKYTNGFQKISIVREELKSTRENRTKFECNKKNKCHRKLQKKYKNKNRQLLNKRNCLTSKDLLTFLKLILRPKIVTKLTY